MACLSAIICLKEVRSLGVLVGLGYEGRMQILCNLHPFLQEVQVHQPA